MKEIEVEESMIKLRHLKIMILYAAALTKIQEVKAFILNI